MFTLDIQPVSLTEISPDKFGDVVLAVLACVHLAVVRSVSLQAHDFGYVVSSETRAPLVLLRNILDMKFFDVVSVGMVREPR